MAEKLLHISECKNGDVLARDLFNQKGVFLAGKGMVLNHSFLDKMLKLGITSLYIEVKKKEEENIACIKIGHEQYEKFEQDYRQDVKAVKTMINDLAKGKGLDYALVKDVAAALYQKVEERDNIIYCLSTLKAFDEYTYNHSVNVAMYCMLIGKWLSLPEPELKKVIEAGVLHDIGKSQIPDRILNKKGKLTDEEFEVMKKHPSLGYAIAKGSGSVSEDILQAVLMHHEREDGSGYPGGCTGDKLNLLTKIVSIADVYDALTSERIYKKRITPFDTFKIIETTGLGCYDTLILLTFLHNIADYYIGMEVILNTGEKGKIVHVTPHNISKPIIRIDDSYLDTGKYDDIKIVALVN